jgi:hypothetical protein
MIRTRQNFQSLLLCLRATNRVCQSWAKIRACCLLQMVWAWKHCRSFWQNLQMIQALHDYWKILYF